MAKSPAPTTSVPATSAPATDKPELTKRAYTAPVPAAAAIAGVQGGSGQERRHPRNHKAWLKDRARHGKTWTERKTSSLEYCPSKAR
jgi:hypothetical protein